MSAGFDWRTDDESEWPEASPPQVRAASKRARPAAWLMGLAAGLVLGLVAGIIVFRQVEQRAAERTETVAADVEAAFNLWLWAIAEGDRELFDSLLYFGREPGWAQAQRNLFAQRLLLDRSPFGLTFSTDLPPLEMVTVIDIMVAPDLQSADVLYEVPYQVAGDGATTSVTLQHLAHFRLADRHWQAAPPDNAVWGETITSVGRHLTVVYVARDEAVGRRLAADLESKIVELCGKLSDIRCPDNFKAELRLDTAPFSLAEMAFQRRFLGFGSTMVMPSPTLVGTPVDEAAYQALLRGYAEPFVTTILVELLGDRCCSQAFFDDVLRQLAILPPLPERPESRDTPALPDQKIKLLCGDSPTGDITLYHFDPFTGVALAELTKRAFLVSMSVLPNDEGVLLHQEPVLAGAPRSRTTLWRNRAEYLVYNGNDVHGPVAAMGQGDPAGRYIVSYLYDVIEADTTYTLLDLHSCRVARCDSRPVAGWPVWSPDGQNTILLSSDGSLYQGDGNAEPVQPLGGGRAPFWIDNQTYGYVIPADLSPAGQSIMAVTFDGWAELLVKAEELRRAIPEAERPADVEIQYVTVNRANRNLLFVAAKATDADTLFIFSIEGAVNINRRSTPTLVKEIRLRLMLPPTINVFPPFTLSPDGRWLTASAYDGATGRRTLVLHDIAGETTQTYDANTYAPVGYDWSADGRWLLNLQDGYLDLIAPADDYQIEAHHNLQGCTYAAWVH